MLLYHYAHSCLHKQFCHQFFYCHIYCRNYEYQEEVKKEQSNHHYYLIIRSKLLACIQTNMFLLGQFLLRQLIFDNTIKKCFTIILKKWMVFYQYPLLHKHYKIVLKINFIKCYTTRIYFNILESVLHKNTRCSICSYTNCTENNDSIFFIKFR